MEGLVHEVQRPVLLRHPIHELLSHSDAARGGRARERKKKREVSSSFSGFEFVRRDGVIDARGRYAAGAIDPIARARETSCQHMIQGARAITGKIFSTRA